MQSYHESTSDQPLEAFMQQQVVAAMVPISRMGEAGEFVNMACFRASDAAPNISGTAISVDSSMAVVV